MEFGWHDARTELDRDTEIAIELLSDYVAEACERVRARVSCRGAGKPRQRIDMAQETPATVGERGSTSSLAPRGEARTLSTRRRSRPDGRGRWPGSGPAAVA